MQEANIEYTTDISPVMARTKRTINIDNGRKMNKNPKLYDKNRGGLD